MSTLPDFEGWAIFAKVAQRGSFSRAAEELGLAKTTVSKAVARLEARMRTNLFQRTTRKLTLTESGRQSLARATRILSDGAAIEADIIEETVSPRGLVRLAALSAMGIEIIAPALPEFLERFPDIEVDLVLTDNQVDIVAEGFDAAVQLEGSGASTLRSTRLWTLRRPLVAAPSLIERLGMPQGPEDLTRYPAVVASHIPDAMEWTFAHQNDAGGAPHHAEPISVRVQPRYRANHADAMIPALVNGVGIGVIAEYFITPHLKDGRLIELLPEWSVPPRPIYLVTPPGRARPARVRVLLDFLQEKLAHEVLVNQERRQG
ncbi:LysR family transcriptional regulator [Novosphingobium sp.]|jgi:DNA-binding transcriptional LysR family regulator|uniref:LysR family transcriptional regulator n=1 Tax=Novosphingobium sp. TaxID=1874826 RepID=UPI0031E2E779